MIIRQFTMRQELASWEEVGTECQFWKTIVHGRRIKRRILINLLTRWSRIRYRSLIWKHPRPSKNKISRKISEKNKNPEMVMDANYHFGGFCTEICEVSCPEGKNLYRSESLWGRECKKKRLLYRKWSLDNSRCARKQPKRPRQGSA